MYPTDKNAPFKFQENERLNLISKPKFSGSELINIVSSHNTVALYFSGWDNQTYLKVAKHFQHKIPTILGIDNPWKNSIKQRLSTLFLKKYIKKRY